MMSQSSCHHPATTNDPFSSIGLPWLALGLVFDADLRYQILSRTGTQIIPAAGVAIPWRGKILGSSQLLAAVTRERRSRHRRAISSRTILRAGRTALRMGWRSRARTCRRIVHFRTSGVRRLIITGIHAPACASYTFSTSFRGSTPCSTIQRKTWSGSVMWSAPSELLLRTVAP